MFTRLALLALLLTVQLISGFYLPGLAPKTYCKKGYETAVCKSALGIFVNRLDSVESVLPYEYSHFDFCQASEMESSPSENLGQVVFGERIRPSPFKLNFLEPLECTPVCTKKYQKGSQESMKKLRQLKKAIHLNYQQHWIVDNLPVIWCYITENNREFCSRGFPVGCSVNKFGVQKDVCKLFVSCLPFILYVPFWFIAVYIS